MKKFNFFLILLFAVSLFAANTDRYYQGAVTRNETATQVIYEWIVTIGADSSDQLHSPPCKISDCNNAAYVNSIVSAASDVNVYYHYGTGELWYTTVTASSLDATSSTRLYDSMTTATAFRCADYIVFEIDGGGTTCNEGEIVTLRATFVKDDFFLVNGQPADVGYVINSNKSTWTNP